MNMFHRAPTIALLAGAGIFGGAAEPAQAGLVQGINIDSRPASALPSPDILTFDKFDSSLGDLTAVHFVLDDYAARVTAKVVVGAEGTVGSGNVSANFTVTGPTALLYTGTDSATATCATPFGTFLCDAEATKSASISPLTVTLTTALAAYEGGVGETFDLTAALDLFNQSCTVNDKITCELFATWTGTITVSYDYTPADPRDPGTDVAEPETLALFGLSLLGLVAVSRRSQGEYRR